MKQLALKHGTLPLPCFLPDATRGYVRAVDSSDLEACGTRGLVMNAFHLASSPGSSTVKGLGGLHAMSGWSHPIITDSGGFQAFSLIRENPRNGSVSNKGLVFHQEGGKQLLTPEKAIQHQLAFGADILFCLDQCTHPDDPPEIQDESVTRSIAWAKRCRVAFDRGVAERKMERPPLLFAVVQGGNQPELRRQCAEAMLEIGFDGYGFGGYPVDGEGRLVEDSFALLRELIPREFPLHALGLGHPDFMIRCAGLGYQLFDSAMPTRDARRGRLYHQVGEAGEEGWLDFVYIRDDKHIKSNDALCDRSGGLVNERYSRGYLHHLFANNDSGALRLATLHNLHFVNRLMEQLRDAG